jgi:hypothetical protein
MQKLVTDLFGRWEGKTALVIGGGPSVLRDIHRLDVTPDLVISANEHGMYQDRFKVDLITNVDKIHASKGGPMEGHLRPFGVPIVNRHTWADYRLPDWTLAANTGLQAIALAALLGASPILVTGIDMWANGRVYFHDKGAKPPKDGRRKLRGAARRRDREKVKPLVSFCSGAHVRPLSGPLTEWFKAYDPAEVYPQRRFVGFRVRLEHECDQVLIEVVKPFRMSNQDYTRVGQRLALSHFEYQKHQGEVRVLTAASDLV